MSLTPSKYSSGSAYSTPKTVTNRTIDGFLVKIREEKKDRWEFDFQKEKPTRKENGDLKWTSVSPSTVPVFYRELDCADLHDRKQKMSPRITPLRQTKVTEFFPARRRCLLDKMKTLSFEDSAQPSETIN